METTGAGKLPLGGIEAIDRELIEAVYGKLQPIPEVEEDAFEMWKKDPTIFKKQRP